MIKNIYNRRIIALMKEQKKTQRDLAELLGIAQPTVHQRLNSDKTFDVEDLIKVARFLKVSISEILYESTVGLEDESQAPSQVLSPADLLLISTKRHEDLLKAITEQAKTGNRILGELDEIRELLKKALGRKN